MTEIYISEPQSIDAEALQLLLPDGDFAVTQGTSDLPAGFASDADALIIRTATTADKAFMGHFPKLQAIIRVGTGLDNVDLEYCRTKGIAVYSAAGANADAVAEYVIAVILYVRRRLFQLNPTDVAAWDRFAFRGHSMSEQKIGILGFGHIGRLLQQKAKGLGCTEFMVYDPYLPEETILGAGAVPAEMDDILSACDIISLHLPLTDETRHLINETKLAMLKDEALLINASRGGVVDEEAVLRRLEQQQFYYVADTVEQEPHVDQRLLLNDRVIVTPHIASLTSSAEGAMLSVAVENYLSGKAAA